MGGFHQGIAGNGEPATRSLSTDDMANINYGFEKRRKEMEKKKKKEEKLKAKAARKASGSTGSSDDGAETTRTE